MDGYHSPNQHGVVVGKIIKWSLLALVVCLIVSRININTSIYKKQDNSVEIIFPQWQLEKPWFYFYWTPGTLRLEIPPKKAEVPEQ